MTERPLRILLVENHPDTVKYLSMYLEQSGHVVQGARSLEQATRALASSEFDVLLSDIALADGTGWELLTSLERRGFLYPIAMSGYGTTADANRSKAAGYRHHLVKPIDPDDLDRLLENARRERDGV
jgi:DNA-binding NtrC family response regulator